MSAHLSGLIWKIGPQERIQRFVLLAIADQADDDGYAWPSVRTLASKTLFSERYVIDAVQQLEAQGWMRVERRAVKGRYTAYFLDVERMETLRDEQRAEERRGRSRAKSSPENDDPEEPTSSPSGAKSSPQSHEQSSPQKISHEIRDTGDMNSFAVSGEIRDMPYMKKHHDTSLGGDNAPARDDDSVFPEGLSELSYATGIMEHCFLAGGFRMKSLIGETIRLLASMDNLPLHKAGELLEQRIAAAQKENETVNSFWFEDQKWKTDGGSHGTNQGHRSTQSAAARADRNRATWDRAFARRRGVGAV